jgi:hypothetical protein
MLLRFKIRNQFGFEIVRDNGFLVTDDVKLSRCASFAGVFLLNFHVRER